MLVHPPLPLVQTSKGGAKYRHTPCWPTHSLLLTARCTQTHTLLAYPFAVTHCKVYTDTQAHTDTHTHIHHSSFLPFHINPKPPPLPSPPLPLTLNTKVVEWFHVIALRSRLVAVEGAITLQHKPAGTPVLYILPYDKEKNMN